VQTLITAVSQVGVDLNAMAANTWRQAPLQFVPGLGPRKARALLAAIAANDNHVKTRVDLLRPNVSVEPMQQGRCVACYMCHTCKRILFAGAPTLQAVL
jgi:hypothetical protein